MRGCLAFLLVASLLVGAVAWVAPVPAANLALGTVFSGLLATPTTVGIESDFPPELLTGHADALRARALDASLADGRLTADRLELELLDVSLLARSAAHLAGSLTGVGVGADRLPVERIELDGSSGTVIATAHLRLAAAERLVRAALAESGLAITSLAFRAPDAMLLVVGDREIVTRLEIRAGSLIAVPVEGSIAPATLLDAPAVRPLELQDVRVVGEELLLDGTLPGSALGL